jgi:hypothetical protein
MVRRLVASGLLSRKPLNVSASANEATARGQGDRQNMPQLESRWNRRPRGLCIQRAAVGLVACLSLAPGGLLRSTVASAVEGEPSTPTPPVETASPPAADAPASQEGDNGADVALPGETSKISESINEADQSSPFWANYYGILYGPSVSDPSSYQSTPNGTRDVNRPVLTKNYITAGVNLSTHVAFAATGWWNYVPVQGGELNTQDPSARLAYNDIIHTENFNWYGDVRSYFPVTAVSRQADLLAGFQTFHYFSYVLPETRVTLGTYASVRYNYFGKHGAGDDLELYVAPAVSYQASPKVALTTLYEFSENHSYGADPFNMYNDGSVIEPGVEWAVTPTVYFNPYFYIYTNGFSHTGVGATVSWLVF